MEIGRALVYNAYYVPDPCLLPEFETAPSMVKWIIRNFLSAKKICGSRSTAQRLIRSNLREGVMITDDEIDEAYAIAAGGGCEYEWPYE